MRILSTENEKVIVEYNYVNEEFIITNNILTDPYITIRKTAQDTLNVLKILIPTTEITLETLNTLATSDEEVGQDTISYKYDNTNFFIKEFVFNGYEDYALTVNPEKAVILVNNSNLVFDLTLSESLSNRLNQIKAFYYNKLKLVVPIEVINSLYEILLNSYKPQVVNHIAEATNPITQEKQLKYTATASLNNFSKKAPTEYSITKTTVSNSTLNKIANIYKVDNMTNLVYLLQAPTKEIKVGDTVQLFNTSNTILNQEFSDDGTYIIKEIISDTIIKVDSIIPITYITPMPALYAIYSTMDISSSSTNENTIVVSKGITNEFSVGDEIQVLNTTVTGEFGSSNSLDGTYTIREINGSTIYVSEPIPYNYNFISSYGENKGIVFKKTLIGNAKEIINEEEYSIVSLVEEPKFTLKEGDTCAIMYIDGEFKLCKVSATSITPNKVNIQDYEQPKAPIRTFEALYGELRKDYLGDVIILNVTKSADENKLPLGEFILLNSNQCSEYLELVLGNTLPSTEIYNNLGETVEEQRVISIDGTEYVLKRGEMLS